MTYTLIESGNVVRTAMQTLFGLTLIPAIRSRNPMLRGSRNSFPGA
ncbi:hypothetical protein CAter282_1005 [Collimonas arenae]|uniref:Uncharacterized protein n=1 Tax=Collimonas arenae TaxID=279058 RepID=A0A127QFH4_9BURK|nr:hypothetical protein CAter10_1086 [Collimonas arenae]AMP08800.1 hypothetical protein CAter282_1005 [Collimonas arenae]